MKRLALTATLLICLSAAPSLQGSCQQDPVDALAGAVGDVLRFIGEAVLDIALGVKVELAVDYWNPTTRGFVLSKVKPGHEGYYRIAQICDVWEYCNRNWRYFSDPAGGGILGDFTLVSDTIAMGLRGDCDDFAALIAAVVRGLGGTAMVRLERTPADGHSYTLIYIGTDMKYAASIILYVMARYNIPASSLLSGDFGVYLDPNTGLWLNLDWYADRPGSPHWASATELVLNRYYITPSDPLTLPILQAPRFETWPLLLKEFSEEQLQRVIPIFYSFRTL